MKKKLLLILALAVVLCLVFAAVACDPPEDPEQPEQPAAPAEPETPGEPSTPAEPEQPAEPEGPATPSLTPGMHPVDAAKILFGAEDTYLEMFEEDYTFARLQICKVGNEITMIERNSDGSIYSLKYVRTDGEQASEYRDYKKNFNYSETLFFATELTGDAALPEYYEDVIFDAIDGKSLMFMNMMAGSEFADEYVMVDESNLDALVADLKTIDFTKDDLGAWHTPYYEDVFYTVENDRMTCLDNGTTYYSYMSALDTPANMFTSAYAEIEQSKIVREDRVITPDMSLEEAVNAAAQVRTYSIFLEVDGVTTVVGAATRPEGMTLADMDDGAVPDYSVLISRNTEGKITQLSYFDHRYGTYNAGIFTLNAQTGKYNVESFTGEEAAPYGEFPLYAQALPLLLSNGGTLVNEDEWNAVYAEIDEKYTLSEDGWYRTSDVNTDYPAYRIEENAIAIESVDGIMRWVFDKTDPSELYRATQHEILANIGPIEPTEE